MRFYHCGDIGDIIFSLPVVKAMGGGTLYLDPEGGRHLEVIRKTTRYGRMKFDRAAAEYLAPLLAHQPYIDDVQMWDGQVYDVCLSDARQVFNNQRNIVSHYTDFFGLDYSISDAPWIEAPADPSVEETILLTRTLRYQCNYPEWDGILYDLRDKKTLFLGLPFEHEVFCRTFDVNVPFRPVANALEAASIVRSSRHYVTNQGANHAIAIALDKRDLSAETQFNESVCRFPNRVLRYF